MSDSDSRDLVLADDPPPLAPTGVFLGPGLAYESVSLTTSMVVQDAASMMRQFSTVSAAALAVITEKILETEGTPAQAVWAQMVQTITQNLDNATKAFTNVGAAAANVLSYFKPGSTPPPLPK